MLPCLHRPTLDTSTTSIPLLISMIVLGMNNYNESVRSLALTIHRVTSRLFLGSTDFGPRAPLWVIQCAYVISLYALSALRLLGGEQPEFLLRFLGRSSVSVSITKRLIYIGAQVLSCLSERHCSVPKYLAVSRQSISTTAHKSIFTPDSGERVQKRPRSSMESVDRSRILEKAGF